ncbi:MAG: right-handed parallel beta-helix repeat-containing protein, partial [Caulobacterales bacterium]|nr:right-handed parallel beta-helix repeat-containing protein [Caulobacterales bacterium]
MSKINALELQAGDRVLLQGGCRWEGQLAPKGRGAAGRPVVIESEGKGRARIDGNGKFEDAVVLKNMEWVELRGIEVTNWGEGEAMRRGVDVWLDEYGRARHIVVEGMYVHHVNGVMKDNHR